MPSEHELGAPPRLAGPPAPKGLPPLMISATAVAAVSTVCGCPATVIRIGSVPWSIWMFTWDETHPLSIQSQVQTASQTCQTLVDATKG